MPPLIGAAVAAAVSSTAIGSTAIIGSLTIANVAGALATTAVTFGLQQALGQQKGKKTFTSQSVTVKEADPMRIAGYGRMKLAGATAALHSQAGFALIRAIVHCEGPVDAFEAWYSNDSLTYLTPPALTGAVGVPPWMGAVLLDSRLGTDDQIASGLLSQIPGWSANHRLLGLAYTAQMSYLPPKPDKYFQLVFPDGEPRIRVILRMRQVLDVRDGVTRWSQNPALCIRDFMIRERLDQVTGKAWRYINASRIDDASFAAFADLCDEPISLAAGGTEPRYRLDGIHSLDEEPREVLRRMLATCDAELIPLPTGKIGIRGGRWEEPEIVLTEDMFISLTYQRGDDTLAAYNQLKWKFTDIANDFELVDGDPWDDVEDQNERGELLTGSADFTMVQSHTQGRRLAKITTAKANPRHRLRDCIVKMPALALVDQRLVRVKMDLPPLDAVFVIERFEPSDDFSTVTLDLASLRADAYEWDPAAEEGTPPSNPAIATPSGPPEPQGVELTLFTRDLLEGVRVVGVRASADAIEGGSLIGQYRIQGTGDDQWIPMFGETANTAVSDYLVDGTVYEIQVAYAGIGVSGWSPTQSILATADQFPPGMPTGFVANGGSGQVMLAWTAPNSANVRKVRVYRAAGSISPIDDAGEIRDVLLGPNQAFDMVDSDLDPGSYRYWVRALNGSGVVGDYAGPIDVTVS